MRTLPRIAQSLRPYTIALAALVVGVLAAAPARAATLTWGTSGTGGSGTWTSGSGGWWNGSAATWSNANPDNAVFAAGSTAGTVTLGGNITAGSLTFDTSGYTIALGANNLTATSLAGSGSMTFTATTTGGGATGVLTISGSSSASGGVTLGGGSGNIGTVVLGNNAALGSGTVFSRGMQIQASTAGLSIGNAIDVGAGGFRVGGSNNFTFAGTIKQDNTDRSYQNYGTATVTLSNIDATSVPAGRFVSFEGGQIVVSGSIFGTGNVRNLYSTGTVTLSGSNTYSGGTTLSAGQINVNNANAIGTGAFTISGGTIDNTSGGAITLATNNAQSWNADFTFAGTNPLNLGTGAVTLSANRQVTVTSSTLTVGGVVGGAFSLTKTGAGTLALTGNSNFSGGGTVSAGTLAILGSNTSTGSWTVNGGTLDLRGGTGLFPRSFFGAGTTYVTVSSGTLISDKFTYGDNNNFNQLRNNYYVITINGGVLQLTGSQSFLRAFQIGANGGTIDVPAGSTITKDAGTTASENIIRFTANSSLTFSGGGTFTMNDALGSYGSTGFSIIKNGTGTLNFGGAMAYTGSTTINGGTFNLTALNALLSTSSFTVNSGATANINATNWLVAGHGTTVAATRVITANGGSIVFGGSNDSRIGNVTLSNSGTFTSNNTSAWGILLGNVDTGAATVTASGSSASVMNGSGNLRLQGVQNFAVSDVTSSTAADLTVSLALVDPGNAGGSAGGINKTGAGTMTLTNSGNSFTGAITIGAGVLEVGGSGRLNSGAYAGSITNSGTLVFSTSNNQTLSGAISNNGSIVFSSSVDQTLSSAISGAGGITQVGGGRLMMGGTSTYSGTTTIGSSGRLEVSGNPLSIANSVLNVTSSGSPAVDIWAGKLTVRGLTGSGVMASNGSYNNGASWWWNSDSVGLVISPQAGESYSFGGTLNDRSWNGSAVLTIEKAGEGTQTLTTSNGYTGGTLITAGTLVASNSGALGGGGTVTLNTARTGTSNASLFINATSGNVSIARPLTVANQGTGTATLGSASTGGSNEANFTGAITLAKDVVLDTGSAGDRLGFSGGIGGTGNVTVVGSNRVVFTGVANTYSGSTTITAGANLQLSDASAVTTDFIPNGSNVVVNGLLSLAKGGNSETINALLGSGTVRAVAGADTLVVGSAGGSGTYSGTLVNAGATLALTKSGAGTQVLTGSSSYTGATTITGGTLQVGGSGVLGGGSYAGAITNNATLAIATSANQTLSGNMTGSGSLVKSDAGTLALSGSNSFSGGSTLAGGVLALGSADALGTTGTISFTGGTLQYSASNTTDYSNRFSTVASQAFSIDTNGQAVTLATALTSSGATLAKLGSGTLTLTANNTYSGVTTVSAGILRIGNGGATGAVAGNIATAGTVVFDRSGALSIGGIVSGAGSLVQAGSGTTTLSGVNTYSGATTIMGGVLAVSTDANLGTAPGSATPGSLVIDGGSLAFTSGFTLASNRGIALGPTVGSGSGTIDVASGQTLIYGGVIANNGGTGGLSKTGAGVLSLTGSATFSGDTSVDAGTLQIGDGASLASPSVTVASGATLSGRGTVNAVSVSSGGILAPGIGSSGTLTTGTLTFSGAATVTMGVSVANVPSNLLNVLGSVTTLGSGTSVVFAFGNNLSLIGTGTYSLLAYTGTLSDSSAFGYTGTTGGRQSVAVSGTTVAGAVSLVVGNAFPLWTGTNGNDWFASDNWELNTDLSPTNFQNNDTVDFNDLATTASGTVVISGSSATPASVTFSANTKAYTLESTGGFGISTGSVLKSGSALVTITNANTYDGGTTLSAGRLRVGDDGALGTGPINVTAPAALSSDGSTAHSLANGLHLDANVTLGDSTDTGALTISGTVTFDGASRTITTLSDVTLSGPVTNGGLTKSGSGVLAVTGSNNYAGGTTLAAGTLRVGDNAALGSGGVTLANGVTLSSNDTGARTLTNLFTLNGDVTLGDGTDSGALSLGSVGGVNLGGATRQVTTPSNVTFAGAVTNGGLTKLGAGTLTLSASNSYAAGTTLSAGAIALGNAGALGGGALSVAGNGTIRTAITGTIANAVAVDPAVTVTFDATSGSATYSGVVSGSGAVVKTGVGTVVLSAASTYSGDTTISAGTLELGGAGRLGGGSYAGAISNSGTFSITSSAAQTFSGAIANAGAITVDSTGNQTISGAVTGGGGLTKSGAGTLTLSSSNAYSGGTELLGGTLSVSALSGIGSGYLAVKTGGTFAYTGSGTETTTRLLWLDSGSSTISIADPAGSLTWNPGVSSRTAPFTKAGPGSLTMGGAFTSGASVTANAGLLTLTASNSHTGGTTVTGGTLQIGAGGSAGSVDGNIVVASAGTLLFNRSDAASYSGVISGSGNVTQVGSGTTTLGGSSTFTGTLTVSQGGVSIASINNASANGPLGNSAGAVVLGSSGAVGTLAYTGGSASSSKPFTLATGGTGGFDVQTAGATLTLSGAVGGSGGLLKQGAGTLTLTNATTVAGPITISTGTLEIGGSGGLGSSAVYSGTMTNNGTLLLTTSVGTQRLSGPIGGTGGITSTMANALYMGGTYTYSGTTTIGGSGYLEVSNSSPLSIANSVLNVTSSNGTRAVDIWAGKLTVRGLTGSATVVANGANDAFSGVGLAFAPQAGESYTFTGTLNNRSWNSNAVLQIEQAGAGTQVLTGNNGFTGGAIITSGTLGFANNSLGASGAIRMNGGALRWESGNTQDVSSRITLLASTAATLDVGTNDVTLASALAGGAVSGSLVKAGAGTLMLSGVNVYTGDTTISSGTLALGGAGQLGGGTYSGAITNDGSFAVSTSANQTLSGSLGGTGSLTKGGAGTLTLSNAANAFTGGSTISAGILSFASGALGSTGAVTMNGGTLRWESGNTQDVSSRIALISGSTAIFNTNGNAVTLATSLGAGTSAALTKTGAGSLVLSATTGYSGATTISGGTLALSGAGSLASSSGVNLTGSGARLDISGASGSRTVAAFEGVAGSSVLLGGNTLTADNATTKTFAGVISGSGGFTKAGAGILTLSDVQTFTGDARVDAGTLAIGGSNSLAAASRIFVASGATLDATAAGLTIPSGQTLGGYGTVSGTVNFLNGSILSPGGSVGSETASAATWNSGFTYLFEVNNASGTAGLSAGGWDLFTVTGTLTLAASVGSPITIDLTSLAGADPGPAANFNENFEYAWKFAVAGAPISTFNPTWFTVESNGFENLPSNPERFYVARGDSVSGGSDTELYIVYAAVPEPGTLALAGIGLAVAGWAAHRRRRPRTR